MPRSINLTGITGKTYDLEQISTQNTRTGSDEELRVQIWYWNPNFENAHKNPNPPDLQIGQIWLSKWIDSTDPMYNEIASL